ncbi:hypothetical protein GBA52_025693 [Prunus armeniaca]|nr:hypothetical protein GBA52_025693 [Prunus armeniaca]
MARDGVYSRGDRPGMWKSEALLKLMEEGQWRKQKQSTANALGGLWDGHSGMCRINVDVCKVFAEILSEGFMKEVQAGGDLRQCPH